MYVTKEEYNWFIGEDYDDGSGWYIMIPRGTITVGLCDTYKHVQFTQEGDDVIKEFSSLHEALEFAESSGLIEE